MKSNFITEYKIKRKAKALKRDIINEGVNKNYSSVHSLITNSENTNLHTNEIAFSILGTPAVVRTLNDANNYFVQQNENNKAYECFIYSLRIRNRQRENIDSEIGRNIDEWQSEKIQLLAEKGYDAYKHTRYLAIQALMQRIQSSNKLIDASESYSQIVDNYLRTGKLKGFYLFYLKEKIYQYCDFQDSVFIMLRKGLRDPLIRKLIIAFLHQNESHDKNMSASYVNLYLSALVEDFGFSNDPLSLTPLFNAIPLLPEGDEKTLLQTLEAAESGVELSKLEKLFFKLKNASTRYYFIRLVSGVRKDQLTQHFAKNACLWKTPTFVAKLFKQLFDGQCYELIIDLFSQLPDVHREQHQIFTFYIGSLRNTDQVKLAKELLKVAPAHMPELTILSQEYYLYKKEKDFSGALQRAKKVYELQPERNKQRWAFAIVELMGAEGDFEAAREYVAKHPEYAAALLPLIHFQEGTLASIEHELVARVAAGEKNDELHYYLSYLYCERKAYPEAIEQITEAVEIRVNRRNALHYILLKSVVEKDYQACMTLIRNNQLDSDVLFAKYYAHSLIQSGALAEADDYLNRRLEVFNATEKGASERKLLLANSAKLAGDHEKSFELFASIFPEEHRCFTSTDKVSYSFAVMNLKSTAPIIRDDKQPLISVIMTNFGWSEYTPVAIQSILDQTHSNFELIIIDDHSEKNAYRKLAKFVRGKKDKRVKVIRLKQNSGTYRAKNHGLSAASGEYITFQDSDDWSHPYRLSEQLTKLIAGDSLSLAFSYCRIYDNSTGHLQNGIIMRKGPITLFFRRIVFETIGYFDAVRTSADSEYLGRIVARFGAKSFLSFDAPYYIASFHERSLTSYGLLSIDPILGVRGARKAYSLKYKSWHKTESMNALYISYPLTKRMFEAPSILSV